MPVISKPVLKDTDVWASGALEEDILIPNEKIDGGWSWANKPSFQYLNWFWKTQTQFYTHLNQNGIPNWDGETYYGSSGFCKYNDVMYQSVASNEGTVPGVDSRVWRSFEFINGLHDIEIDMPAYRDLLIHNKGIWENKTPRDAIDMPLDGLFNVTDDGTLESVFTCFNPDQTDPAAWGNNSIQNTISDKLYISDFEDTRIDDPVDEEILQFRPYKVWIDADEVYEDQWRWQNTYYQGYVNFNNIENTVSEYKCIPASRTQVGGARMWVDDTTETYPIFHVETTRVGYVPKPYGLKSSSETSGVIKLEWTGTSVANKYYIYRDGVKVDETTSNETYYSDPVGDNQWHVYYVTAMDVINSTNYESDASNHVMGKTQ